MTGSISRRTIAGQLGNLCLSLALCLTASAQIMAAPITAVDEVISGKFELQNHLGETVTEASYQGQYRLVFFGFISCPDICPTTMVQLGEVMALLGDKQQTVKPLFISVDHENDSTERLAQYIHYFHPSFDGLTGTAEQIKEAAKGFNTNYGKNSDTASKNSSGYYHSAYIYLMDKEGKLIDLFSHATSADIIVRRLEALYSAKS